MVVSDSAFPQWILILNWDFSHLLSFMNAPIQVQYTDKAYFIVKKYGLDLIFLVWNKEISFAKM